jgi:hypothetical protein
MVQPDRVYVNSLQEAFDDAKRYHAADVESFTVNLITHNPVLYRQTGLQLHVMLEECRKRCY